VATFTVLPLGLFFCLYVPLKGSRNRIKLMPVIHNKLDDWRMLLKLLATWPTHICKTIPDFPTWMGTHNAPSCRPAGKDNYLADAASRQWDLSGSQLCSLFDYKFPQATTSTILDLTLVQQHCLCQDKVVASIHSSRASTNRMNWHQWCTFCTKLQLDPPFAGIQDPIPLL
jgi:hypothetical protein